MHALIVGARGVGKSTLIRRVVQEIGRPVSGFETKKEDHMADDFRGSPVYIYEVGKEHLQTEDNLIGYCKNRNFDTLRIAFDRYAPKLLAPVPEGHIILLDELGFMESASKDFCEAVLSLLDGNTPVIAAVKHNNFPFLEAVRSHPNCRCFYITEENRESLYAEVLHFMKMQTDAMV